MNRRAVLTVVALAIAWGGQLRAEEPVERILKDLRRLGFETVSVERTLLRRTRILAESDEARREIIVNPNTGEILRDLWIPSKTASSKGTGGILGNGSSGPSGSGSGDDEDDDGGGDDDDDDGDDEDHSGHGGGDDGDSDGDGDDSSGKGSGNSGSGGGDED